MEDLFGLSVPLLAVASIFIGLPWLILHYVTKWKTAPKITNEDEQLLDEMFNLARRLEERVQTVERIVAADNPDYKPSLGNYGQPDYRLENQQSPFERRN